MAVTRGTVPSGKKGSECTVLDFDLVEVARQICLVDQRRLAEVPRSPSCSQACFLIS